MDGISTRLDALRSIYASYLPNRWQETPHERHAGPASEDRPRRPGSQVAGASPPTRPPTNSPGREPGAGRAPATSLSSVLIDAADSWLQQNLLDVTRRLDSLLEAAARDRLTLVAINEDLTEAIHGTSSALGYHSDQHLSLAPMPCPPIKSFDSLVHINLQLGKELDAHRAILRKYLDDAALLTKRLGGSLNGLLLEDSDGYLNAASPVMVYSAKAQHAKLKNLMVARMDELFQIAKEIVDLEGELEDDVISTQTASQTTVWKFDGEPVVVRPSAISFEISNALSKLVKSPLAAHFEESVELSPPLSLSWDFLELLSRHLSDLRMERARRQELRVALCAEISRLWEELEWGEEKRDPGVSSIVRFADSSSTILKHQEIELLEVERNKLMAELRIRLKDLVVNYRVELVELRKRCMEDQLECETFDNKLQQLAGNLEAEHLVLRSEVDRLRALDAKCGHLFRLIQERANLIQAMKDFETSASNPDRLFGSSFRLLAEEKWRRTCFPNLVSLESQLMQAIVVWEEAEGTEFIYRGKRHIDALHKEIHDRFVNQTFFNFSAAASKLGGLRPGSAASLRCVPAATASERSRPPVASDTKTLEAAEDGSQSYGTPAPRSASYGSMVGADTRPLRTTPRPTPRLSKPPDFTSCANVRRSSSYGSLTSVSSAGSRSDGLPDRAGEVWKSANGNTGSSQSMGRRKSSLQMRTALQYGHKINPPKE